MKLSDELKAQLAQLKEEAKTLAVKDGVKANEINAKADEIDIIEAKIRVQEQLEAEEKAEVKDKTENLNVKGDAKEVKDKNLELKVFAKVMSGRQVTEENEVKALSSLTDKDGKLLIPVDVQTAINTWLRDYTDMAQYVQHESVSNPSGSRVYEVEADAVPFGHVAELTTIPDMGSPEFQKIEYTCNRYKGMLKIPNELLEDEAGGLLAYISQWIAKKQVATRNILAFYGTGAKADGFLGMTTGGIVVDKSLTAPVTLKYIDKVLNVTLPMAVSRSSECRIYTNQTGFNYLLSLEDKQGRKYLQQDVTNPAIYRYSGKEIVVFDDKQLRNETIDTKEQFPILIGNMKESMKMFELNGFITESDRSIYFDEDATGMRVKGALTTKLFDKKAVVAVYSPEIA
ncbi:phage capsid family protein [Clostridium saccharobutylicum]|uniref:phage major capsid protein n=1 Tax=Clostridium saccharobutylicum TaxID=169679 RepID=UPI000983FE0B|nr:phage major capsid protein [Clostridium saccharobutylicum]AQS09679.1 phage capsid family protein [Clostridium saccharobutylicum]MBC2436926.1 phage major capsid protein [Clostridium saccharobutylicum]NSB89277.1 HK97 family phage major capsid protein [Clostridium saccharobutylicum]NYC27931.1 HK97 family phage major capsid protein [Clostridium saccharobutylicum]OOM17126.1 phage capsid family protein [Clostridium saccharobutylicum]